MFRGWGEWTHDATKTARTAAVQSACLIEGTGMGNLLRSGIYLGKIIAHSREKWNAWPYSSTGYQLSSPLATEQLLSPFSRLMRRTPWVARPTARTCLVWIRMTLPLKVPKTGVS